jgi:hypothetical protein
VKKSHVLIEGIKVDRTLHPGDDISELVESIKTKSGLTHPVNIDKESNLLIDGLRRVEAYKQLGFVTIPAYLTDSIMDTVELQARVSKHGVAARDVTALRFYEFYVDTRRQRQARTTALRSRSHAARKQTPIDQRALLMTAMPTFNEAQQAAAISIYRRFNETVEPATAKYYGEMREKLEAGELTIFQVRSRMADNESVTLSGDVVSASEQRWALTTAIESLSGTNSGLRRLGELNPELNAIELSAYIKGFEEQRRRLGGIITSLRKAVAEK